MDRKIANYCVSLWHSTHNDFPNPQQATYPVILKVMVPYIRF